MAMITIKVVSEYLESELTVDVLESGTVGDLAAEIKKTGLKMFQLKRMQPRVALSPTETLAAAGLLETPTVFLQKRSNVDPAYKAARRVFVGQTQFHRASQQKVESYLDKWTQNTNTTLREHRQAQDEQLTAHANSQSAKMDTVVHELQEWQRVLTCTPNERLDELNYRELTAYNKQLANKKDAINMQQRQTKMELAKRREQKKEDAMTHEQELAEAQRFTALAKQAKAAAVQPELAAADVQPELAAVDVQPELAAADGQWAATPSVFSRASSVYFCIHCNKNLEVQEWFHEAFKDVQIAAQGQ